MTDEGIERSVSSILRAGVILSGALVLAGGIYFLVRHGNERLHFQTFIGQPDVDRVPHQILMAAIHLRARSVIQLGALVLIATPIVRVGVSLVDFAFERDWAYVAITAIVFLLLMYGLVSGIAAG
jgi:uncharacterized membrane protein